MTQITSTFGISSQFEINLDARLPQDPLTFVIEASKAGLYTQFFLKGNELWAYVAGPNDAVIDFQASL
jgi:hypothetical protein